VISNESLEVNVVSIRTDLTHLKTEFRAVVARIDEDIRAVDARAGNEIKRIYEQFREVRQDIRELRADIRTLRDKIDATYMSLNTKIDTNVDELRAICARIERV